MRDQPRALLNILKDKRFTDFEKAVYKAICKIPKGQTRSYTWVAKAVGVPGGARAVGNALNKNPHPGPIPCHRVIKSDGSLGGYAKGLAAKRKLLKAERVDIIKRIVTRNS
jgi:O-6-methylguanine DNA methyltransferase